MCVCVCVRACVRACVRVCVCVFRLFVCFIGLYNMNIKLIYLMGGKNHAGSAAVEIKLS